MHRKSYFFKILFVVAGTVFLFSFIIFLFFFGLSFRTMSQESDTACLTTLDQFQERNDIRIKTAMQIIEALKNDQAVIQYAIQDTNTNSMNVYKQLSTYSAGLMDLDLDIGILHPRSGGSVTLSSINKVQTAAVEPPEAADRTEYALYPKDTLPVSDASALPGRTFMKQQIYSGNYPLIFYYTLYDKSTPISSADDGRDNYLLLYQGEICYQAAEQKAEAWFLNQPAGLSKHMSYLAARKQSKWNPQLSYLYISKNPERIYWGIQGILIFLILLSAALLCSFILSRKLYRPIGAMITQMKRYNEGEADDDLAYISDTTEKLYQHLLILDKKTQLQQSELQSKLLHDLCIGVLPGTALKTAVEEHKLEFLKRPHAVLIADVINHSELTEEYGTEALAYLKTDIMNIFSTALADQGHYLFENEYTSFVLILPAPPEKSEAALEQVCEELESDFGILMRISVGTIAANESETTRSYQNAEVLQNNYHLKNACYLYHQSDLVSEQFQTVYYPLDTEQQMIHYFLEGQVEAVNRLAERIVTENFSRALDIQSISQLRYCFLTTINRILNHVGKNIQTAAPEAYTEFLSGPPVEGLFLSSLSSLFQITEQELRPTQTKDTDLMEQITKYVDQNISHDISLTELAEHLHFSSWHTSRLFKTLFNENFKPYVNRRRVEVAKSMLAKGVKPNQVAKAVGCNSADTFTRIFKKQTGLTPNEYAKHTSE